MAAEAQGKPMPEKERDDDAALNSSNTDLITGLCEDVVLGEVVPRLCRLPWNERPLLEIINRSWNKAMAERRFQMYHQRLHNPPNILSKALIISHLKQISNPADVVMASYVLLSLWVCRPSNNNGSIDEGAITIRLPKHPFIQVQRYDFETIVCDNHRVFTFTPSAVAQERNVPKMIYNVWMLDLRDFNVHWKSLPPLPKLGTCVYASSSSLNGDESSYIWQRRYSDSSMADGWKLHRLSSGPGDIDMNFDQWHWEYFNVNTGPPRNLNFDIMSERLPLYVEIERRFDRGLLPSPYFVRQLYRRCPTSEYILRESDYRSYVFILADGIVRAINECKLCFIAVKNSGICILKVELDEERTRFVKEGDWNDFVQYWDYEIRSRGLYEMPNTQNADSEERSAIKFFRLPDPWRRNNGKQIWDENAEVVDWHSIVRVAQRGPIYGYSYLGFNIIRIP